jgi:hypothetical protein
MCFDYSAALTCFTQALAKDKGADGNLIGDVNFRTVGFYSGG